MTIDAEVSDDAKRQLQMDAGIPYLPTDLTYECRMAVAGKGPRAFAWSDKPHRLVYALCTAIEHDAALRSAPEPVAVEAGLVGWRCFHCDEVFTNQRDARLHFGADESAKPACQIKGTEGGLVEALRRAEQDAADAWHSVHAETTDACKAYYAQNARHQQQLRAVEQAGYDRGLADAKAHPETIGLAHSSALTSLQEQVEALTNDLESTRAMYENLEASEVLNGYKNRADAAEAEVTRLRQRVAEQDAALEPFARHADCFDRTDEYDHYSISAVSTLPDGARSKVTIGDLRTARRAQEKNSG